MFSVTLLVIVIISIFLSSCAFLLSNIVSGSGNVTYTVWVYINGMPKKMVEDLNLSTAAEVSYKGSFSAKFFVGSALKREVPRKDLNDLFNKPIEDNINIITQPTGSIGISSSLTITYSTDTTFTAASSSVSFEFEKSFPLSEGKFYMIFDFSTDSDEGMLTVVPYSKGYKFTVITSKRDYVDVFDNEKGYRLISENIDGKYQCVFIGEKGKTYTFESSGNQKTIPVPQNTDKDGEIKDGEIVDLSGQ